MYRFFLTPINEVGDQFVRNYGKNKVFIAETQKQFEECLDKCYRQIQEYSVLVFDTFLFFDILTENNIYELKKLKQYVKYIVFCGNNTEELRRRLKNH